MCVSGEEKKVLSPRLQDFVDNKESIGKEFVAAGGKVYKVSKADNFEYVDPIDQSVAKNQVSILLNSFFVADNYTFSLMGKPKSLLQRGALMAPQG